MLADHSIADDTAGPEAIIGTFKTSNGFSISWTHCSGL